MSSLCIRNCRIQNPGEEAGEATDIQIENGKIGAAGSGAKGEKDLDAGGRLAVPGLIDVHIQGAGGAGVLDNNPEAMATVAAAQARFGVTAYLATTVYRADGDNDHLNTITASMQDPPEGARCLGIHLEGPFIALKKKGMIHPTCICPAEADILADILKRAPGALKMMTIAPEIEGTEELVKTLKQEEAIASFGHSTASYGETLKGFEYGIDHVTHMFNAMMPLHHREPGPLMAILETPEVTAQLIPDGVHIHGDLLKNVCRLLGPERVTLITDGMDAMGLPDGIYKYSGYTYEAKDGAARYEDGTLIGSACGFDEMIRRCLRLTEWDLSQALVASCEIPARILGLVDSKGKLAAGFDADVAVLNDDLSVYATVVEGEVVFQS